MPFLSIKDSDFWTHCPQELELIQKSMDGTGGGVPYFVMGERKDDAPTVWSRSRWRRTGFCRIMPTTVIASR
jgi:hypothetical protein